MRKKTDEVEPDSMSGVDSGTVHIYRVPKVFTGVLLLVLGTMAGLILSEAVLRLLVDLDILGMQTGYVRYINRFHSDPVAESVYRTSKDPLLKLEFIPNSRRRHIRINSHGFRGMEYSRDVPKGVTRIALLGDSEVFGSLLEEQDTLAGCLEKALTEKSDGGRFQVLNFGFPGYNTAQELRWMEKSILQFNPDMVALYYVLNDPLPDSQAALVRSSPWLRSYVFVLIKYLHFLTTIPETQVLHEEGDLVNFYQRLHHSEAARDSLRLIHRMGTLLEKKKVPFFLVISPEIIGFSDFNRYPYLSIHELLRSLQTPAIRVIDPLPALIELRTAPRDLWITPWDCHKGLKANRSIAQTVAERIITVLGH